MLLDYSYILPFTYHILPVYLPYSSGLLTTLFRFTYHILPFAFHLAFHECPTLSYSFSRLSSIHPPPFQACPTSFNPSFCNQGFVIVPPPASIPKLLFPFTFTAHALIKRKQISSYIRKFRRDQLQNHIWLTASSYIVKYLRISSYIRRPFLIYNFANDPIWISYLWGKFRFLFYQCMFHKLSSQAFASFLINLVQRQASYRLHVRKT